MSDFSLWFSTGLEHILDIQGIDHIVYVIALAIPFPWKKIKTILLLVTAFTLGHSLTLALSTYDVLNIEPALVEWTIALTIALTCLTNLFGGTQERSFKYLYLLAGVFGCIHGLGFSILLKSMLGSEESLLFPLFAFNLGLEVGQVIIIAFVLAIQWISGNILKINPKYLSTTISFVILLLALYYMFLRFKNGLL